MTGNLLTDTDTVSLPLSLSPQPVLSHTVDGVLCYPCEQQLQYQRVLSKPGVSTKEARKEGHSSGMDYIVNNYIIKLCKFTCTCTQMLMYMCTVHVVLYMYMYM